MRWRLSLAALIDAFADDALPLGDVMEDRILSPWRNTCSRRRYPGVDLAWVAIVAEPTAISGIDRLSRTRSPGLGRP